MAPSREVHKSKSRSSRPFPKVSISDSKVEKLFSAIRMRGKRGEDVTSESAGLIVHQQGRRLSARGVGRSRSKHCLVYGNQATTSDLMWNSPPSSFQTREASPVFLIVRYSPY